MEGLGELVEATKFYISLVEDRLSEWIDGWIDQERQGMKWEGGSPLNECVIKRKKEE